MTTNAQIADTLDRIAEILEIDDDNPFRVRAYREAAQSIRDYERPVEKFVTEDRFDDLKDVPGVGEGIAAVIGEYVTSGKSALLEELEGKASPAAVFARVPGIGKELAHRIATQLNIKTLEELEDAAHDERLARVEGFGRRRIEAVKSSLAGMLSQRSRRQPKTDAKDQPSIEVLLKIDEEYRRKAEAGELKKITPRRFNPENEAWLPVMNIQRDGWKFTALFSNTAQAHKLEKTDDWVVIYYQKDGKERQNTVVTETQGALKGKRVVRGREAENKKHYEARAS